ncbi:MAG: alpha/beta hydrolase [Bacteroidia bacterium]|nr:alpha/beta hydrolase [Bacteroidia bacterium]
MNKKLVKLASSLFPKQIENFAYKQLMNPQVRKLREREMEVLDSASSKMVDFKDFQLKTYSWGQSSKRVLLIHGWEGQAGNFASLIPKLREVGFEVMAFDAPSHGFSTKGPTSIFDFIEAVEKFLREFQPQFLVSHSFGGVATTYALSQNPDVNIEKYLLLTTPDKFSQRIDVVAEQTGITERVKAGLINRLKEETGQDPLAFSVSNIVKTLTVKKVLIFHDKNDKVIPLFQSEAVHDNWDASTLRIVENTGHFRILGSPEVLDEAIEFLTA